MGLLEYDWISGVWKEFDVAWFEVMPLHFPWRDWGKSLQVTIEATIKADHFPLTNQIGYCFNEILRFFFVDHVWYNYARPYVRAGVFGTQHVTPLHTNSLTPNLAFYCHFCCIHLNHFLLTSTVSTTVTLRVKRSCPQGSPCSSISSRRPDLNFSAARQLQLSDNFETIPWIPEVQIQYFDAVPETVIVKNIKLCSLRIQCDEQNSTFK